MTRNALTALCLVAFMQPALAAQGLDGDWTVDLASEPGQTYTQPMQLTLNDDGTVAGSFYSSTIEAGRWKLDRGRLCASFRTSDGVGPYDFLFNWNATRAVASP